MFKTHLLTFDSIISISLDQFSIRVCTIFKINFLILVKRRNGTAKKNNQFSMGSKDTRGAIKARSSISFPHCYAFVCLPKSTQDKS